MDANAQSSLPSGAVDSYHLGCLVYEAYNHRFETTDSLLSQKGSIPINMQRAYTSLLNVNYRARASADMFLDEGLRPKGFFSNDFVKVNLFLENISIKEQSEREGFFRKLDSSIETFPSEFSKYKILPELINAFEFGSGGAKALSAIVKVGEHLSDEEYEAIVIQPIVRMFSSPDRAIRVSLLENMPKFINHMTTKMVTNQVFPNIVSDVQST
jgi:SCY1-like protein 1